MENILEERDLYELHEPSSGLYKSNFERLEVRKKSCRLAVNIYQNTSEWKDWGLRDQVNRASISIPSNIAEGSERGTDPDYVRFLLIAKGSAAELRTQLYIANKIGLLESMPTKGLVKETIEISRMLQGLINQMQKP